jgi:ATP-dependent exoDNAse (exonuclease V) beta subunit
MTPTDYRQTLTEIQQLIDSAHGDTDQFLLAMKAAELPSLSFSRVSTLEFCQQRYYLQYILHLDPEPLPDYFTKGKLLHQVIAVSYQRLRQGLPHDEEESFKILDGTYCDDNLLHLQNAARVHLQHLWREVEVEAIETPFAMLIAEDLPPVIGVIDLILRQNGHFIIIDHKSGRDFYPPDELQMAIYREYIHQRYQAARCEFYYDHYRWVRNLNRIRKPAFQRTAVMLAQDGWQAYVQRIAHAERLMQRIRADDWAMRNGQCFRCPYRSQCHP